MAIELNHTVVPADDKIASARFFARILGLTFYESQVEYFAPVRVNETLTLQAEGVPYGSEPDALTNRAINHRGRGRGVYFCDTNRHILELLTVGPSRNSRAAKWPEAGNGAYL